MDASLTLDIYILLLSIFMTTHHQPTSCWAARRVNLNGLPWRHTARFIEHAVLFVSIVQTAKRENTRSSRFSWILARDDFGPRIDLDFQLRFSFSQRSLRWTLKKHIRKKMHKKKWRALGYNVDLN